MQTQTAQPQKAFAPQLQDGEIVEIHGAKFKVVLERVKGLVIKTSLEPLAGPKYKLSKSPWRIGRMSFQNGWVPAITDDKDHVVAFVFGRDREQQEANAAALVDAWRRPASSTKAA